jgi:hypothetical protein
VQNVCAQEEKTRKQIASGFAWCLKGRLKKFRKPFSHAHTKSVHVPYTLFREFMRAVFSLVLVLVMAAADAGPGAGAGAVE